MIVERKKIAFNLKNYCHFINRNGNWDCREEEYKILASDKKEVEKIDQKNWDMNNEPGEIVSFVNPIDEQEYEIEVYNEIEVEMKTFIENEWFHLQAQEESRKISAATFMDREMPFYPKVVAF